MLHTRPPPLESTGSEEAFNSKAKRYSSTIPTILQTTHTNPLQPTTPYLNVHRNGDKQAPAQHTGSARQNISPGWAESLTGQLPTRPPLYHSLYLPPLPRVHQRALSNTCPLLVISPYSPLFPPYFPLFPLYSSFSLLFHPYFPLFPPYFPLFLPYFPLFPPLFPLYVLQFVWL